MLLNEQIVNILSKLIEESQNNKGNVICNAPLMVLRRLRFYKSETKGAYCVTRMKVLSVTRAPHETWNKRCRSYIDVCEIFLFSVFSFFSLWYASSPNVWGILWIIQTFIRNSFVHELSCDVCGGLKIQELFIHRILRIFFSKTCVSFGMMNTLVHCVCVGI